MSQGLGSFTPHTYIKQATSPSPYATDPGCDLQTPAVHVSPTLLEHPQFSGHSSTINHGRHWCLVVVSLKEISIIIIIIIFLFIYQCKSTVYSLPLDTMLDFGLTIIIIMKVRPKSTTVYKRERINSVA